MSSSHLSASLCVALSSQLELVSLFTHQQPETSCFSAKYFFFLYDNSTASSNTVSPAGGFVFSLFCLCVFIPSFPINDYYFDEWDVSPDTTVSVKWQRAMQMFSFFFFSFSVMLFFCFWRVMSCSSTHIYLPSMCLCEYYYFESEINKISHFFNVSRGLGDLFQS